METRLKWNILQAARTVKDTPHGARRKRAFSSGSNDSARSPARWLIIFRWSQDQQASWPHHCRSFSRRQRNWRSVIDALFQGSSWVCISRVPSLFDHVLRECACVVRISGAFLLLSPSFSGQFCYSNNWFVMWKVNVLFAMTSSW